jgi:hypothetical protein
MHDDEHSVQSLVPSHGQSKSASQPLEMLCRLGILMMFVEVAYLPTDRSNAAGHRFVYRLTEQWYPHVDF